jgi:VPDSG-CTERM motif
MKTPRNKAQGLYLNKSNNRWKWMAGATAATAAGVTASQAGTITINLLNNYISATGGNHLNADLTGDGRPDLTIAGAFFSRYRRSVSSYFLGSVFRAAADLNGVHAYAFFDQDQDAGTARLGSHNAYTMYGFRQPYYLKGSIPVFFKDLHINGGTPTSGSLNVTVLGSYADAEINLNSLTYNTVPDQGSTLALLALGASGVLALRRRWKSA